ncbi:MAG: hypothetical protein ACRC57_03920, partial [Sarcina sp.]
MKKSKLSALIAVAATGAILATNNMVAKADVNKTDLEKNPKKSVVAESNLQKANENISDFAITANNQNHKSNSAVLYANFKFINSKTGQPIKNTDLEVVGKGVLYLNSDGETSLLFTAGKSEDLTFRIKGYKDATQTFTINSETDSKIVSLEKLSDTNKPDIKPTKEETASLSFKLIDSKTRNPLTNKDVFIDIINDSKDTKKELTNEKGIINEVLVPTGKQTFTLEIKGYKKLTIPINLVAGHKKEFYLALDKIDNITEPPIEKPEIEDE